MDGLVTSAEDIRACRVCLATEVKLYALHSNNLAEIFRDLTTIPVFQTDGLPQYICNVCCALLRKSAAFKVKCKNTNDFLQTTGFEIYPMTTDYISSLDTSRFKLPLTMSKILVLSVPEDSAANANYNNIEKLKTDIKYEEKPNTDKDESISHILYDLEYKVEIDIQNEEGIQFDDENRETNENNSINDDEVIIIKNNEDIDLKMDKNNKKRITEIEKNNRKRKHNSEDSVFVKNEELKNYLLNCKSSTKDTNRLLFYDYILSKYIHRTKEIHLKPEIDVDIWDVENVDLSKTNDNNQLAPNTDPNKDKFYNYIREKYITRNKLFKANCIFDINKIKVDLREKNELNAKKKKRKTTRGKSEKEWDDFAKAYNFEIITLSKEEQMKELHTKKECARYKASKYKCENCCLGFATESVYKNHMAIHDPSHGKHVCEICHQRFTAVRRLINHRLRHKRKFICKDCNKIFLSGTYAREHYRGHQGTVYKCEFCDKTFGRYATRVNHISIHHGRTPCEICHQLFQGPAAVTLHKSISHKQTFVCSSCNLHFDNQLALDRHRDASSDNACYPGTSACTKCGETFANEKLLVKHIDKHYTTIKKKNKGENKKDKHQKRYFTYRQRGTCCPCMPRRPVKFRKLSNSTGRAEPDGDNVESYSLSEQDYNKGYEDPEHISPSASEHNCPTERGGTYKNMKLEPNQLCSGVTVKINSYDELECEDTVDQNKGETKAERTCPCVGTDREQRCPCSRYDGSKVMCEMCGLGCPSAAALRSHQRVHTGEKPFQCSYCDKRFRTKNLLGIHERSHTGERPFKCPHCDKTFVHSSNLHRHQLVHTKARPYSCDSCEKTFQQSNTLKLHIQTVHMHIPAKPRIRKRKKSIE